MRTKLPEEVSHWLSELVNDKIEEQAVASIKKWLGEVDLNDHYDIDYSELYRELEMSELAEEVSGDIDWGEVSQTHVNDWLENNMKMSDVADHLEYDLGNVIKTLFDDLNEPEIKSIQRLDKMEEQIKALQRPWWKFW